MKTSPSLTKSKTTTSIINVHRKIKYKLNLNLIFSKKMLLNQEAKCIKSYYLFSCMDMRS